MASRSGVLVVDDEEPDRSVVSQCLRQHFPSVLEAQGYSDALAVFDLHRDRVQLIVVDIALPDGNGCALAVAMRRQKPNLRVLFISGHVGSEVCKYYGLDVTDLHFLRKPFSAPQLLSAVYRVLRANAKLPNLYVEKTLTSGESS